jgi:hypothetical protein
MTTDPVPTLVLGLSFEASGTVLTAEEAAEQGYTA